MGAVAVVNATNPRPYVGQIVPFDRFGEDGLQLPYNPESFTVEHNPNWSAQGRAAARVDELTWVGNSASKLRFRQTFQVPPNAILVNGSIQRDLEAEAVLETMLSTLRRWALEPTDSTQEPTRLVLIFGELFFTGVILAPLKVNRVRTNERGHGIVVDVDFTFAGELG